MEIVKTHKFCSKCKAEKTLDGFHIKKEATDGHRSECKDCYRIAKKKFRDLNSEALHLKRISPEFRNRVNDHRRAFKIANPERHAELEKKYRTIWYKRHGYKQLEKKKQPEERIKTNIQQNARRANNIDEYRKKANEKYHKNKESIRLKAKEYYIKNRDSILAKRRIYDSSRKDIIAIYTKKRYKRIKSTPILKLQSAIRSRIGIALKRCGYKKDSYTSTLIGLDYDRLKIYIEKQFKRGMTWDNHGIGEGKWHLDHTLALSSAKTEEELLKLFHYTNLRPMWAKDNLAKGAKIIEHQLKMVI